MAEPVDIADPVVAARRRRMALLASAPVRTLEDAAAAGLPPWTLLRGPETGLVMVRGRAGGTGDPFNLGEMTVTRASVRLDDGTVGHAWCAGRDRRKAELAAAFDASSLDPDRAAALKETLFGPLERARAAARAAEGAAVAGTKVDFFTMVRGENPA